MLLRKTSILFGRIRVSATIGVPLLLLILFLARIVSTYGVFSDTFDEHHHIYWGMDWFERGKYIGGDGFQPPLPRAAVALLPHLAGYRAEGSWLVHEWENQSLDDYWRILTLARFGNLGFAVAVFWGVYWWSRRLFGERSAWAACLLLVCSPTVLGHAGLATVDLAAAAVCWALFALWHWRLRPSWTRSLLVGAATGAAQLCKFSAFGFVALPQLVVAIGWWRQGGGGNRRRNLALHAAYVAIAVWLVVWAGYQFDVGAIHSYRHERAVEQGFSLAIGDFLQGVEAPAPVFWAGFVDIAYLQAAGHPASLFGESRQHGWWYYFPVALALKSSPPLVILAFLGGFLLWQQRQMFSTSNSYWLPAVGIAGVLIPSMASTVNIGVRHVLPIYPLLAILGSVAFSATLPKPIRRRALRLVALALLGWHVLESALAHPDYLAYFTPPARSRDYLLLTDSNLDWGQDNARLAKFLEENPDEDIRVMVQGSVLNKVHLPKASQSPEWVVVSVNGLAWMKKTGRTDFPWLLESEPSARIGRSILFFRSPKEDVRELPP